MKRQDELDKCRFKCMDCHKEGFKAIEGTWPQYNTEGEMIMDENNNRSAHEFVCYDCLNKGEDEDEIEFQPCDNCDRPDACGDFGCAIKSGHHRPTEW